MSDITFSLRTMGGVDGIVPITTINVAKDAKMTIGELKEAYCKKNNKDINQLKIRIVHSGQEVKDDTTSVMTDKFMSKADKFIIIESAIPVVPVVLKPTLSVNTIAKQILIQLVNKLTVNELKTLAADTVVLTKEAKDDQKYVTSLLNDKDIIARIQNELKHLTTTSDIISAASPAASPAANPATTPATPAAASPAGNGMNGQQLAVNLLAALVNGGNNIQPANGVFHQLAFGGDEVREENEDDEDEEDTPNNNDANQLSAADNTTIDDIIAITGKRRQEVINMYLVCGKNSDNAVSNLLN